MKPTSRPKAKKQRNVAVENRAVKADQKEITVQQEEVERLHREAVMHQNIESNNS